MGRTTGRLYEQTGRPGIGDEQGRDRLRMWDLLPSFRTPAAVAPAIAIAGFAFKGCTHLGPTGGLSARIPREFLVGARRP
jgi:hypothetical protein